MATGHACTHALVRLHWLPYRQSALAAVQPVQPWYLERSWRLRRLWLDHECRLAENISEFCASSCQSSFPARAFSRGFRPDSLPGNHRLAAGVDNRMSRSLRAVVDALGVRLYVLLVCLFSTVTSLDAGSAHRRISLVRKCTMDCGIDLEARRIP